MIGRLLLIDALGMKFRELKLRKNPDCPVCGTHPTVTKLIDYNEFCGIRGEEKPVGSGVPEIQVEDLKRRLDAKEDLFVLDVREPHEYQICNIGGYLIPLNDLPKRVNELDSSREIVVHCKMGGRSAKAVSFPAAGGIQQSAQPGRRNYRVVGSRGSEGAEVLKAVVRGQLPVQERERASAPFFLLLPVFVIQNTVYRIRSIRIRAWL